MYSRASQMYLHSTAKISASVSQLCKCLEYCWAYHDGVVEGFLILNHCHSQWSSLSLKKIEEAVFSIFDFVWKNDKTLTLQHIVNCIIYDYISDLHHLF